MLETDNEDMPAVLRIEPMAERTFARRMKRERLRQGWRQEDLAERLARLGLELHPSAIAKMEREPDPDKGIEPRMIRLNEAMIIAFVFKRSLDQMLSDEDLNEDVVQIEKELAELKAHRALVEEQLQHIHAQMVEMQRKLNAARIHREERRRLLSEDMERFARGPRWEQIAREVWETVGGMSEEEVHDLTQALEGLSPSEIREELAKWAQKAPPPLKKD